MKIIINGTIGSGKSTVAKKLAQQMYKFVVGADTDFYEEAEKYGINRRAFDNPDNSLVSHKCATGLLDRSDIYLVDKSYALNECTGACRIFLYCDPRVAARRMVLQKRADAPYTSVEECIHHNYSLMLEERQKSLELFKINPFDLKYYHFIIDTTYQTVEQVVERILHGRPGIYLSAGNLLPTKSIDDIDMERVTQLMKKQTRVTPKVSFNSFLWFVVEGHHTMLATAKENPKSIIQCVLSEHSAFRSSMRDICDFERCGNFTYNTYPKEVS